jgi:proteasome component ECM29
MHAEALLTRRKLGVLNFSAAAGLAPREVFLHYVVAAADPQDAVSRRAEELLGKRCAHVCDKIAP